MLTALIDYESGNLHSAQKAFERMAAELPNEEVIVTSDPEVLRRADRLVLPGDGAFPACKAALVEKTGLYEALLEAVEADAKPFLGICVGMQMMASFGHEYQTTPGLDWIAGDIRPIKPTDPRLKVPHMGWNDLVITGAHPVLAGLKNGDHAYFVHSYHFKANDPSIVLNTTDYCGNFVSAVSKDLIFGVQYHPEKSHDTGIQLLANFVGLG